MMKAALTLAQTGLAVFPCGADKAPLTKHGFKDATTDPETIRLWASAWTNVGAAIPEGAIVIDVDPRNGGDDTMALLPALPRTRTTRTRSGGRHYWLTVDPSLTLRGILGPGVDAKRYGKGYVIVPPSPGYTYVVGGAMAPAPDWLIAELEIEEASRIQSEPSKPKFFPFQKGTPYGAAALRNAIESLGNASNGGRNDALNKVSYGLAQLEAGGEIERDHALNSLLNKALEIGLSQFEAMRTIESGWLAGEKIPRQAPS